MENVVQQTIDYDQFNFIENNREQSQGHIWALKEAFTTVGNLTRVQPILVNERFDIIDGQHRFTAARELGEPIFYTVVPGLGINEARSMNILHRAWAVEDFARSYALGGNSNYQKYLQLKEDYGFNHSTLLNYIHNSDTKGIFAEFRVGDFVIPDESVVRQRLDILAVVAEITPLAKNKPFAIAILKASQVDGFSVKQLIKKLTLHGNLLYRMSNLGDNARMIEDIYNHGLREDNRLRLY